MNNENTFKIEKQQELNKSYISLIEQKLEMERQLEEYYSILKTNNNQSLYANQKNMTMRIWGLILCIILLVTIKQLLGTSSPPVSMTIWLLISIALIVLTFSLRTPIGFLMWFLIILGVVISKT